MVDASTTLRLHWRDGLTRGFQDAPLIAPLLVAELGPAVQIADVRPREEFDGVLGYIPGSAFVPVDSLDQLAENAAGTPLVLVCADGEASARVARELEMRGRLHVAAMKGGIAAWRADGLRTSRDPGGVRDVLEFEPARTESGPLTLDRVREHVGDPRSVRWIKLTSLISQGRISCIDGRDAGGVIGAPGGDGGEFLLKLAAVEQATGKELDEQTVERGLLRRLDEFGNFYLHTDVDAFTALTEALQARLRIQNIDGTEDWFDFLRCPPEEMREAVLEQLVLPEHLGCGHIRLMLLNSEEYGTRRALVESFLRSFFRLWWAGAPEINVTVLPGEHEEAAVLNVRLAGDVWSMSRVPLISPSCDGRQMFVNHPDVSAYLRRTSTRFLVRHDSPLGVAGTAAEALADAVEQLAERQLSATAGRLAANLPVFDVVFAEDGSFDVQLRN